jgi:hypothetical protein
VAPLRARRRLQAQPIKPDTRALAAILKAARAPEKGVPQYPAIRTSFLAWVDARLKSPEQIDSLNRELRRAGLSGPGRDEFWGTDNTGLLEVAVTRLPSAPDLFAARLGIGVPIDYDQTIVLYQRQPWRPIGWLNHELTKEYSLFSSIAVGPKDAAGNRLIVSCGYAIERRYSGPFPAKLRIDVLDGVSLKTLLNKEVTAEYNYEPGREGI